MRIYRLYWDYHYEGKQHVATYNSLAKAKRAGAALSASHGMKGKFKRVGATNWALEELIITKEVLL